jgi:hypothetical protein
LERKVGRCEYLCLLLESQTLKYVLAGGGESLQDEG